MDMQKGFIILGIVFIAIGVLWKLIGKLPGDIVVKKENVSFYFPIVTCMLISGILSLVFYIIGRFK
jgi:H+/Cl- antiporter ClcA